MHERQSAHDHPRSDDVKGRERHDGEDERGIGDTGDFGDRGIDQSTDPAHAPDQQVAPASGAAPAGTPTDLGSQAD